MKSSKQHKANRQEKSPTPSKLKNYYVIWAIIILAVVVLAILTDRGKPSVQTKSEPPTLPPEQTGLTNAPAAVTRPKPDFQKLKGKWLRPDGGYVIEIKSADDNGKLDAAYFNPRPIHVFKAEASQEGAVSKVFIELRDVNYPGSTYTLTYVPERDLLAGIYYQAAEQQSFEVYFERLK